MAWPELTSAPDGSKLDCYQLPSDMLFIQSLAAGRKLRAFAYRRAHPRHSSSSSSLAVHP
uniref:Uncharacterized protein n=1 Tax=Arundo donax TaxID=35708 RepID=A0A0A9BRM4_ARUDO